MDKEQVNMLRSSARKLIRELGILKINKGTETPSHWHAITEIANDPGITIMKLGNLLLMSDSKISRLIKSLAKEGKVISKAGPDKREKYLYLTEAGKEEVKKIDSFSKDKILGAAEFLKESDIAKIIEGITIYSKALEQSRVKKEQVKIRTLSTSRPLRKRIADMVEHIQKIEFKIPITEEINISILKAEEDFYYNNSYNFWYAIDDQSRIIGSIGLKRINNKYGEIKKLFVIDEYRGKSVAQKLMDAALKSASKHGFEHLVLGTVSKLERALTFYAKYGFTQIDKKILPKEFEHCPLDDVFMKASVRVTSPNASLNTS